jgi:hypothetical protein
MKSAFPFITIVLCCFLCLIGRSQSSATFAPGIYKTYFDVKVGKPSQPLTDSIYFKTVRYGFWGISSKKRVTFQHLNIDRKQARQMEKVFAISDGEHLYLKTNGCKMHKQSNFSEAQFVDQFLVFADLNVYVVRQLPFLWWTYPTERFVDLTTGKLRELNRFTVRRLIKKNETLLTQFKKDKKKDVRLKEYLSAYSALQK